MDDGGKQLAYDAQKNIDKTELHDIIKELKGNNFLNVQLNPRVLWYHFLTYLLLNFLHQLVISSMNLIVYVI